MDLTTSITVQNVHNEFQPLIKLFQKYQLNAQDRKILFSIDPILVLKLVFEERVRCIYTTEYKYEYLAPDTNPGFNEFVREARRGKNFVACGIKPSKDQFTRLVFMYASGDLAILVSKIFDTETETIRGENCSDKPVPIMKVFEQLKTMFTTLDTPNIAESSFPQRKIFVEGYNYENYTQYVDSPNLTSMDCVQSFINKLEPYNLNTEFIQWINQSLINSLKRNGAFSYSRADLPAPFTKDGFVDYLRRAERGEEFLVIGVGDVYEYNRKPCCIMYAYQDVAIIIQETLIFLSSDRGKRFYREYYKEHMQSMFRNINTMLKLLHLPPGEKPPDSDRLIMVYGDNYDDNLFIEVNN